jgi:hypothetical protein
VFGIPGLTAIAFMIIPFLFSLRSSIGVRQTIMSRVTKEILTGS